MNYIGKEPAPSAGAQTALDALAARIAALEAKQTIVALVAAAGVAVSFAALPPGLKKLWIHLLGVSTNGASLLQAQLGDASGYAVAGYHSNACGANNANVLGAAADIATGFTWQSVNNAGYTWHGVMSFVLAGNNTWVAHGAIASEISAYPTFVSVGSKVLAGALDRVRITTVNGVDTFDLGQIGIAYE